MPDETGTTSVFLGTREETSNAEFADWRAESAHFACYAW